MTQVQWKKFVKTICIRTDIEPVTPVQHADIDDFENAFDVKLPPSYRSYCLVFGAGEFGKTSKISVPGYKGRTFIFGLKKL
jgi:hypothetical protein